MSNNKKYIRPLSAIERYNLVINEVVRYNVDAIVEGEGELDLQKWQQAVDQSAQANPGVRVRLRSFLGFAKWVDSGIAPKVEMISAPDWDGQSEIGAEFLREKFAPLSGGPVCDVKLIPGSPARIAFRGLHAAMDARGLTQFILDTFRALRGEELIGSTDPITDLDIRLEHQDKVTAAEPEAVAAIPTMPPAKTDDDTIHYIWRRVTIGKNLPNPLPKMAIFLAEQARLHAEGPVVFTIPIDFRTLRHEVASTANLTGYLRITVDPDDSPKHVMRKLNQQIRDHADCRNPGYVKILPWIPIKLLVKLLRCKAHRILHSTNEELPTAGIVSLGYFNAEEATYNDFKATHGFGIPGSVGKLNVLLHNYKDKTEIIFSSPEAYNKDGQLDTLINNYKLAFDN